MIVFVRLLACVKIYIGLENCQNNFLHVKQKCVNTWLGSSLFTQASLREVIIDCANILLLLGIMAMI